MAHRGLSLIEILVSIAMGLSVVLAAGVAYQSQRQSALSLQVIDAMHHNANAALDNLTLSLQSADAVSLIGLGGGRVRWRDAQPNDWVKTEGKLQSDYLSTTFASNEASYDCQGNRADPNGLVSNGYQRNDKFELTCKDSQLKGGTYQAIAEGVEDIQIRFAERLTSPNSNNPFVVQWKNADQVQVNANVLAIELCLLMVSTQRTHALAADFKGCNNETRSPDGKLRKIYRRVINIRSHAETLP